MRHLLPALAALFLAAHVHAEDLAKDSKWKSSRLDVTLTIESVAMEEVRAILSHGKYEREMVGYIQLPEAEGENPILVLNAVNESGYKSKDYTLPNGVAYILVKGNGCQFVLSAASPNKLVGNLYGWTPGPITFERIKD